jgi:hypothetical protein
LAYDSNLWIRSYARSPHKVKILVHAFAYTLHIEHTFNATCGAVAGFSRRSRATITLLTFINKMNNNNINNTTSKNRRGTAGESYTYSTNNWSVIEATTKSREEKVSRRRSEGHTSLFLHLVRTVVGINDPGHRQQLLPFLLCCLLQLSLSLFQEKVF